MLIFSLPYALLTATLAYVIYGLGGNGYHFVAVACAILILMVYDLALASTVGGLIKKVKKLEDDVARLKLEKMYTENDIKIAEQISKVLNGSQD